jgi:cytochrome P450
VTDDDRKKNRYHFARHDPAYRDQFEAITTEMVSKCPVAWSDTYGGHWVASGHHEVFELARSAEYLSNDHDVKGERRGYKGITIPSPDVEFQGGFLEMDPPAQRHYRQALNPYLSPAAVQRWLPVVDELVRASINEKIETGRIDFVDDLANIVPAVLTLAMLGIPLKNWDIYVEPVHASVYTPPDSPNIERVRQSQMAMYQDLFGHYTEIKANPRPGMIDALARAEINGKTPDDMELIGVLAGAVHYETIGVIQGMQHLPATFTPGPRVGDGLAETVARMQVLCDEQRLADPVTRKGTQQAGA